MIIGLGDNVIFKSNPENDLWKVIAINLNNAGYVKIKGLTNRLIKLVSEDEVEKVNALTAQSILENHNENVKMCLASVAPEIPPERPDVTSGDIVMSKIPGTVLHLDSDGNFLNQCLNYYKEKGITSYGYTMKPAEMPGRILELLNTHNPNILVITGHDGFTNKKERFSLGSYVSSKYFIESVKQARKFDKNKDNLVIFAGACESFYEALMESGANFASSPRRVSIHTYDPAIIAVEIALTPILSRVNAWEVISKSKSSFNEIGGIDTVGTLRNGIPFKMHSSIYTRNSYEYNSDFLPCTLCVHRFLCFPNGNSNF
jgi:spore coat assemly protein